MQRSAQKELLDLPGIAQEDIRRNMEELEIINSWLGGHAITIAGLKELIHGKKRLSICEIGCGGGDNLSAIARWCQKNGIAVSLTGIDINPFCIQTALEKWHRNQPWGESVTASFIISDYKLVQPDPKPDIIFSSLFCHHFPQEELIAQLRWMQQQSAKGFFINDLHRHPIAYHSIKILTRLFSKSYLVKHDAPLSVKRGFVKSDWLLLMEKAGIDTFSVHWKWAFRWLVVVG